jgi:hypothetical protein
MDSSLTREPGHREVIGEDPSSSSKSKTHSLNFGADEFGAGDNHASSLYSSTPRRAFLGSRAGLRLSKIEASCSSGPGGAFKLGTNPPNSLHHRARGYARFCKRTSENAVRAKFAEYPF